MRIHVLHSSVAVYSARAYLVLGNNNSLDDVNTLVDVGTDGSIVDSIASIRTGVGKKPVDRVVLTHSHFDHSGGLNTIIGEYHPEVLAFASLGGVTRRISNGDHIKMGDEQFEVLHVPEHSSDSICLFSAASGTLFSGDTPLSIRSPGGSYQESFAGFLEDLIKRNVRAIYSGHDLPNTEDSRSVISETLKNVKASAVSKRAAI